LTAITMAKNGKIRLGIRSKMLTFCIILLILPTLVVGFVSYQVAKDETEQLVRENIRNSVISMQQNIQSSIELANSGFMSQEMAQRRAKELMLGPLQEDGTRAINKNIHLGENGYFFVLDKEGTMVAHPNREGENLWDARNADGFYYTRDIIEKALNGGGFSIYNFPLPNSDREASKIIYAVEIPEWDWIVAAGSYYQDYSSGQTQILMTTVIAIVICTVMGIALILLFSNHITRPIRRIADDTKRVAAGDLTTGDVIVRNKDEIGDLAANFNLMKQQLISLVAQVTVSADKVTASSRSLQQSIGETTQAGKSIADATQQIASGIDSQAQSTHQSTIAMEEMAQGIQRIADTATTTYEASVQSVDEAKAGQSLIRESIDRMHAVGQVMKQIVTVMQNLNQRSGEISNIVTVISDIANQTSLLSLNASIEAARAGEAGRGFAVVAREVQQLSEMSKASAQNISKLVKQVQSDIEAAVQTTTVSIQEFEQGVTVVERTGSAFDRIVNTALTVAEQAQEASAAAEELSANSEQVYATLQELNHIARRTAEGSESISALTEEQIAMMEQIHHESESLSEMAQTLKAMIDRFKV
jgi:Methyl-accepting chemotaxis protein